MSTKTVFLKIPVIFILFVIVATGCTCKTCRQNSSFTISIPDSIFAAGDNFIESRVGTEFFKHNFFRDYIFSKRVAEGYYLRYNYRSLDYDFVDEPVFFFVDTLGMVLKNKEIHGIPNCRYAPEECVYNINEEEAIQIAQRDSFPEGIRPWDVSFRWEASLNKYIWHIISTTWEAEGSNGSRAKGEEIMIAPQTGEILKHREWYIR